MLELADRAEATRRSTSSRSPATGRVLPRLHGAGARTPTELVGRIWTLREVTADRELDRMRDAFVATVSHELRTPLTSISGFLEMMQDEEDRLGDDRAARTST